MTALDRAADALAAEARATNERRVLVLTGEAGRTREAATRALDAADVDPADVSYVGTSEVSWETIEPNRTDRLLGTTHRAVVLDCHDACRPNALGRAVGAVDGGGLLVLLAPPLVAWPDRRDGFDESLAVPPFGVDDVGGTFRSRLVRLLEVHPGIAVVDVDAKEVRRDGLTDPAPRRDRPAPTPPSDARFPDGVYARCRTADQVSAVEAFEGFLDPGSGGSALVVEADRGRGKSSAAGLGAAALALEGRDVLVTAPAYRNAAEVFARAREVLDARDADPDPDVDARDADPDQDVDARDTGPDRGERPARVESSASALETGSGAVRYERPADAADLPGSPDVVIVDEAAALPVGVLEAFLAAPGVAFTTTVHGYEGAGRGFSVRFRDRLVASDHAVTEVRMDDPIRYAAGDPVEVWAFRALGLDARPATDQIVADATPDSVSYRRLTPRDLVDDEHLLREVFGLLVLAHYRTEPDDLARLLDAPNVSVRALTHDGHVVSVALLAREGGLSADVRSRMYEGARIPGNMIPDVLTSQLRDETAGVPVGQRVLRIATHGAVRSRGLGSGLVSRIRDEYAADVDWLGTGYGATPRLVRFWQRNGFRTVHLSVRRNESSGEHSVVMLDPTSEAGERLHDRHAEWFLDRVAGMLSDPLDRVDPDVVRATLDTVAATPALDLSELEWRLVAGLPGGASVFDTSPRPFRRLTLRYLVDAEAGTTYADPDATADRDRDRHRESSAGGGRGGDARTGPGESEGAATGAGLTDRQERLLVRKVLQGRDWESVASALEYPSRAECMRALGGAVEPLVSRYGPAWTRSERERFE